MAMLSRDPRASRHALLALLTVLPLALVSLGACSEDAAPASGADSGATTPPTAPPTSGRTDGGAPDGSVADGGDGGANGPVISTDPLAPTPLAVGESVSAELAAETEHFFEFTPAVSGDHTLRFTAPSGQFYASYAAVKEAHSCGLPACVQGTGTAPLPGLVAGTTYYLNLFNGAPGAGSYTISVTNP